MKILDCTLRDGGYYTNWDFDQEIIDNYITTTNSLQIEYLEIGYRSLTSEDYKGQFFYCSELSMKKFKDNSNKKIAVLIDQKNVSIDNVEKLLFPCKKYIDLIRIAVHPAKIQEAFLLAKKIKKMHFEVAFNVMYLSEWDKYPDLENVISKLEGVVDYFYMVDSYGSIFPKDVVRIIKMIKEKSNVFIGFHGHNNLELALINTLTAIDNGVDIVDATVTGMGRGAGNLKIELLLSVLNKQKSLSVNFDALSELTTLFENLKNQYKWGTSLPYMVSGVRSLPQKEVMEWVTKQYYSLNSVVRALNKKADKNEDVSYPFFLESKKIKKALIIGGGNSVVIHNDAIKEILKSCKKDICIIHASSKNAYSYKNINVNQYFCLVGNEGLRMSKVFKNLKGFSGLCILPPSPRKMGTYVPEEIEKNTLELKQVDFTTIIMDSHTAIAIQTALDLKVNEIFFAGFDGYIGENIAKKDHELFQENTDLFSDLSRKSITFSSITPTNYKTLPQNSVYKLISKL